MGASKKPAPRPGRTAPRNAALEAAIVEEPESPDAYLVYGDWLLEQGEPLAELVSVQARLVKQPRDRALLSRERVLLRGHKATLGQFADCEHTWSFGFLESIALDDRARDHIMALFELVPARFLRELDVEMSASVPFLNRHTIEGMAELGIPQSLRKLALQSRAGSVGELGDMAVLYPRLARLRELAIRGAIVDLGAIDLPDIETFAFESLPTTAHFRSLAAARWPKLRSLSLGFADARDRVAGKELASLLSALASLENVRHLGLADHHEGDGVVGLLVAGQHRALVAKLTSLDLSRTGLTDAGAKVLLDNAAAFEHMDSIDLRENELSTEPAKRIEKALDMADLESQGMRGQLDDGGYDEDDGYDDIQE